MGGRAQWNCPEVKNFSTCPVDTTAFDRLLTSNRRPFRVHSCAARKTRKLLTLPTTKKITYRQISPYCHFPSSSSTQYELQRSPRSKPMVSWRPSTILLPLVRIVLIFCIAGLLFLCASSTSNIGSVSHPAEAGLLIPSVKRWLTFLRNHREAIAAMDFFTVPPLTFGVLYCFFVIGHDRRKILHFHVTRNPHALSVVQ